MSDKPQRTITVWFFVGALFTVYGVLILGAGIFMDASPDVKMQHLHIRIWWGALLLVIGLVCRDTMSEAHWASASTKTQDQACGFTIGRYMQGRAKWRLKALLSAFAQMLTEWVEGNWG